MPIIKVHLSAAVRIEGVVIDEWLPAARTAVAVRLRAVLAMLPQQTLAISQDLGLGTRSVCQLLSMREA